VRTLGKAANFLLIPLAAVVLVDPRDRERALHAFMAAIALTVLLSTLRWLGAIPADVAWLKSTEFSSTVVFKYHLTQNLLVAIGALVFAVQAGRVRAPPLRVALWALCVLSIVNVMVMGDGRTGQLVLLVLIVFYAISRWRAKGVLIGAAAVAAIAAAAYLMPGSALHQRTSRAVSEALELRADAPQREATSVSQRFEYYTESLRLYAARPVIGTGTGGFPAAYERHLQGSALTATRNPHSEYLLKAVELGVFGALLLLALFAFAWRTAARLPRHHAALVRGLVVAYGLASLVTTTLSDHTEGLLFAWALAILCAGAQPALTRHRESAGAARATPSQS
jgi:O-antigen ligase